jgi:hypothetical protein
MSETTATRSELGDEDGRLSIGALMRANRRLQDELQLEKGRSLELSQVVSRLLRERGEADTATDRRRQELQEAVAHGPRPSTAPAEARPRRTTTTATIKLFEAYYAGSPFATDAHQRRQSLYEACPSRSSSSVRALHLRGPQMVRVRHEPPAKLGRWQRSHMSSPYHIHLAN